MAKSADTAEYIIKECERLSQPSTRTTMNELAKLQHDAVHYLLGLGTEFDTIRQKVEELQFQYGHPPIWQATNTGQLRDQPIVPSSWSAGGRSVAEARISEYISTVLTELKKLLVIAKARKKSTAPANRPEDSERSRRDSMSRSPRERSPEDGLRDALIYAAIKRGLRGMDYCQFLKTNGIKVRSEWWKDGPREYPDAYKIRKRRALIHKEKSRTAARLQNLRKGELKRILKRLPLQLSEVTSNSLSGLSKSPRETSA